MPTFCQFATRWFLSNRLRQVSQDSDSDHRRPVCREKAAHALARSDRFQEGGSGRHERGEAGKVAVTTLVDYG